MRVIMTARELLDGCIWAEFCDMRGINEWALNEGLVNYDTEFVLCEAECKSLGLVLKDIDRDGKVIT